MQILAARRLKQSKENIYSKRQLNDRMNWVVKYRGRWLEATYTPTNETLTSQSRKGILDKVNRFVKEKQK